MLKQIITNIKPQKHRLNQITFKQFDFLLIKKQNNLLSQQSKFQFSISPERTQQLLRTRKDDIFTISLIGRPNVGKSSLFNKLSGGDYSITDPTPGLTRDRKEVISNILGYPIRVIDTAGLEQEVEQSVTKKQHQIKHPKKREQIVLGDKGLREKMFNHTLQALMYSDLVFFIIDAREGITPQDLALASFLKKKMLQQKKNQQKQQKLLLQQQQQQQNNEDSENNIEENQQIKQYQGNKGSYLNEVVLLANKCDIEEIQDEIVNDVYKLGFGDPLYISAEQGDGLTDLLAHISKYISQEYAEKFEQKRIRRLERHIEIRKQLRQEVLESLQKEEISSEEFSIKEWEYEFDIVNKDPEDNSDLDTDSEVDPKQAFSMGIVPNQLHSDNYYSKKPIQMSLVGRANAGKSTLVNSLLQEDRVIVDDLEGTTRDSINVQWVYKGRKINLIDTAGIDKKMKNRSIVEKKCYESTMKSIRYSNVVVCMIDALRSFQVQDLSVAQFIAEEGRAMVLIVNKWDLVPSEYKKKAIKYMERQLESNLSQVKGVNLLCVSAKKGQNLDSVMEEVMKVYQRWNIRITTGNLNDWLNRFKKTQASPASEGQILKIRFIAQIKTRPPTFAIFVNDKQMFKTNYLRYFRNSLTDEFELQGVPVRILIRDSVYKKNKKRFENDNPGEEIKKLYRQKRKISGNFKQKLDEI